MQEILEAIVKYLSILWKDGSYRIVDSSVSSSFGGLGSVLIASDRLQIFIAKDRGSLSVELRRRGDGREEWYRFDLLRLLISNVSRFPAIMEQEDWCYLRDHLHDIERIMLDGEEWPSRRRQLKKWERDLSNGKWPVVKPGVRSVEVSND